VFKFYCGKSRKKCSQIVLKRRPFVGLGVDPFGEADQGAAHFFPKHGIPYKERGCPHPREILLGITPRRLAPSGWQWRSWTSALAILTQSCRGYFFLAAAFLATGFLATTFFLAGTILHPLPLLDWLKCVHGTLFL
jgi:hypothetical protein